MKKRKRAALEKVEESVSPVSRKWKSWRMATSASQMKKDATSWYPFPGMQLKGTRLPGSSFS